jgi:hypothetical protein
MSTPQPDYDPGMPLLEVFNLSHCGLSYKSQSSVMKLFMRPENQRMWVALNECDDTAIVTVTGCPDVGKSLLVFAHAMHYCQRHKTTLLYCHKNKTVHKMFIMHTDGSISRIEGNVMSSLQYYREEVDITVLDGIYEESFIVEAVLCDYPSNRKLILCTSYQAVDLNPDSDETIEHRLVSLTMLSWTCQDFLDGMQHEVFNWVNSIAETERESAVQNHFRQFVYLILLSKLSKANSRSGFH